MDNLIYILFVSVSIPILFLILLVEKKARLPVVFMLIGIFVSVFASEVNALLARMFSMDMYNFTEIVTPISEENLRALPILYYAIVISEAIIGRIDTTTAPELEATVDNCLSDTKELVLDLAGVEYISSAGLRVLLKAHKSITPKGNMKILNVNEAIMEVFEITGFSDILTIE